MRNVTQQYVLCFGELVWDLLPNGKHLGGAPLNVAAHLNILGMRSIPVTAVGLDLLGAEAIEKIRNLNISTQCLSSVKDKPTGTVGVTLTKDGVPEFLVASDTAWDFIPENENMLMLNKSASAIVYGSLSQRMPHNRALLNKLLDENNGIKIFDINLRKPFYDLDIVRGLAEKTDIIKLSIDELALLIDSDFNSAEVEKSTRVFAKNWHMEKVCLTCGSKGAGLLWDDRWLWEPSQKVKVVDTVGAGDAFLARMIYGVLSGEDISITLFNSCRLAERVVTQHGAIPDMSRIVGGKP